MLKMAVWLSLLLLLPLLNALTGADEELVQYLTLIDQSSVSLHALSHKDEPLAVSVTNEHLNEVSTSVLRAETWVRTTVLAHYPATKITTIVVGNTVLCSRSQEHLMGFVLPSVKNIYHSLARWGLEREIKVSASFSSNCLNPSSASYRNDLADEYIRPLLDFLREINSTYSVNPPPDFCDLPEETLSLVSSHTESMKNLGVFNLNKIDVLVKTQKGTKPISRKLSLVESEVFEPFPARPTPLAPTKSPTGYSVPAFVTNSPLPPLVGTSPSPPLPPLVGTFPSPPFSLSPAPEPSPVSPPYGPHLPPCDPSGAGGPAPPLLGVKNQLWCVAKPSVPADTLQEAMDYACGDGGADCEAIQPSGSCYFPDTILAHASYAFNSYWQKHKRNGGTCSFGGTAMLINADPSFHHCRFNLA